MTDQITKPCYRAISGNSFLVIEELDDDKVLIFFPFTSIRGELGTLPKASMANHTFLGDVIIDIDGDSMSPNFESLLKVTGGN